MADTLKRFGFYTAGTGASTTSALGTTSGTLYTAPSGTGATAVLRSIHVCNTTAAASTITLALNAAAGTAANQILGTFSVPAYGIFVENVNIVLNSADYITGLQGTASALTLILSGVEL